MADSNGDHLAPGGYPLGMRPSPPDERDYPYAAFGTLLSSAELPETHTCEGIESVDNQGAVQSCVACSLGLVKDSQEFRDLGRPVRVSRQWLYANREERHWQGPGMYPREALVQLCQHGVVPETLWPGLVEYGQETWPAPRDAFLPMSQPFKVATYVRVEPSFIPQVKSAVYTLGPALFCVAIHANFAPNAQGVIPLPEGALRGYHAMAIVGWRHGCWLVQNSWGSGWGLSGRCWIPWQYPVMELWTITDADTARQRVVEMVIGSKTMLVDGKPVEMDVAPQIVPPGRTMLPVRFVAEGLGAEVEWFDAEKRVRLTRKEYPWP